MFKTSFVAILFFLSAFAFAHDEKACKGDIDKFCKQVQGGRHSIMKCLKEHDSELSTECKEKSERFKKKFEEMQTACKDDVEKFCKDADHGHMIWKCLKKNKESLSESCKAITSKDRH